MKKSLTNDSLVYSFGVGNDISFDLSLINKYGCKVYAFDPTPRVTQWMSEQVIPDNLVYVNCGIASSDKFVDFFAPVDEDCISHISTYLGNSKRISVKYKFLQSFMNDYNHSKIDLLKMDIEGFEYDVIHDIIGADIRPVQILIEFHHLYQSYNNFDTESCIKKLQNYGYELFYVSDTFTEYSFKKRDH